MLNKRTVRACVALSVAVITAASVSPAPEAQGGVTITFPARLAAGPDFATDVLKDAWDMSNSGDISPDPLELVGWSNFAVSGGLAGGGTTLVNGVNDTTVSFLFRGHFNVINPGKNGVNFPIDSSRYQKLAFRVNNAGPGQNPQVYWFHNSWSDPNATDSTGMGMGVRFTDSTINGTKVVVADMTAANGGEPWASAPVRGFRIDPNSDNSGHDIFFDWVRLTYADNAPGAAMQTITWAGGSGGTSTIDVVDAGGTVTRVATSVAGTSYSWNYGVLPSGQYTLRVTRSGGQVGNRSFTINNPPRVAVTDPSRTTGEDYATSVLQNAWDMSASNDIQITGSDNFTGISFAGDRLTATNTNADPNITLLSLGNNSVPIDTTKYRYLTYRMEVDGAYDLGNGSVARVLWASTQFMNGTTATTSKDVIAWAGLNSYTIDLATLSNTPGGGLEPHGAAESWTAAAKRHFRLDPHEFIAARTFHVDDVKLRAMPVAPGAYTIRFSGSDADTGDAPTVSLYYDTDQNPSNGKTLIVSGLAIGAGSHAWDTDAVPNGVYYIYAEAHDGVQPAGGYSDAPVQVTSAVVTADPLMSIDVPTNNSTLTQPFVFGGWAFDRGAPSGTGVDALHVYAFPTNGGAATFVGVAAYFGRRDDVGAAFGARFTNSGFTITVNGLAPGTYTLVAYAHSTVTGDFNNSAAVMITLPTSMPLMSLDAPGNQTTVGQPFNITGWAVDLAAPSGTGVNTVHVYAYPNPGSGQAPVFLGIPSYGGGRGDVGSAFGAQFTSSSFFLSVSSLAPGPYRIVVYAYSTVAQAFNNVATADITVSGPASSPLMSIDTPVNNSTRSQPFAIGGWAIDRAAPTGTGVNAIHLWATRVGGSATFVGAASYGAVRGDVGGVFGSQFTNSGYNQIVSGLSPGTYDIVVYARSTVTGTFNHAMSVRVAVQ